MGENAENKSDSFPQDEQKCSKPKKKRTGEKGVSKYIPALVWLLTIFFVGMVLGNLLWLATADVLAFGREDRVVEITIESTDTLKDISDKLAQEQLITYPWLFRQYARLSGMAARFRPGSYEVNAKYDYPALAKALASRKVQREMPLPCP